jgi:hypothetical protein
MTRVVPIVQQIMTVFNGAVSEKNIIIEITKKNPKSDGAKCPLDFIGL